MAHPAAHRVENRAARRKALAIDPLDVGDRDGVDVLDEARVAVEVAIRRFVDAAERARQ
jgi:hypothetical protein